MSSLRTYASRFQLMMAARNSKAWYVSFNEDGSDTGLYLTGFRGSVGTSLAARGPREDLEKLVSELRA